MGLFQAVSNWFYPPEQRSAGNAVPTSVNYGMGDPRLSNLFSLHTGNVSVTEESALSLATVYRCVDVLSSSFASLPWDLYRFDGTVTVPAEGHPVRFLLSRPHRLQTSYVWRKVLLSHALLWGNGYARIIRNGIGRPTSFKLYHPAEVNVLSDLYRDTVEYRFPDVGGVVEPENVIHLKMFSTDGLMGRSVVRMAAEAFRGPMQSRRLINSLLQNGGRPAGIISSDRKIANKQNIKDGWFSDHGGENSGKTVAVLDEGLTYQQVSMSPVDTQLLEFMNLTREEVCSLFGVPQHMAGILTRSTNNNIEHQGLEYLSYSLRPHVENFQQEFDYKALLHQEFGRIGSRFDTDSLQLIDVKTKREWFQFLRNAGILSANEVRDEIGYNPYEGGDTKLIQGAMVAIDPQTGIPILKQPDTPPKPLNGVKLTAN